MIPAIVDRPYQGIGYHSTTGVSPTSERLNEFLKNRFLDTTRGTILLSGTLETLNKLQMTFAECQLDNWDSEGAVGLTRDSYRDARSFICMLPLRRKMPEVVPFPNGQIGLEWYVEKNHTLVITFAGFGSITYASLFGSAVATSGVLNFRDAIPNEIMDTLSKLNRRSIEIHPE